MHKVMSLGLPINISLQDQAVMISKLKVVADLAASNCTPTSYVELGGPFMAKNANPMPYVTHHG